MTQASNVNKTGEDVDNATSNVNKQEGEQEGCDCGCHFSDFSYRGGIDCALCGENHEDHENQTVASGINKIDLHHAMEIALAKSEIPEKVLLILYELIGDDEHEYWEQDQYPDEDDCVGFMTFARNKLRQEMRDKAKEWLKGNKK